MTRRTAGTVHTVWIATLASRLTAKVPPGRIVGIDLARTIALVGMMATHLYPALSGSESTPAHQVFAGRASGLFAVLAGLSLALVTGRRTPLRGRERVARSVGLVARSAGIYLIGHWLTGRGSDIAIILPLYAVMFVAMIPFFGWRPRNLAILAAVWTVLGPLFLRWLVPVWPDWTFAGWDTVTGLLIDGTYPGVVWLPYFWVGLAIGRLKLDGVRTAGRLLVGGAGLAVAATIVSDRLLMRPHVLETLADDLSTDNVALVHRFLDHGMFGFPPEGSTWWLASVAPHSGTPFDLAQTIGAALFAIGLCLLLGRWAARSVAVIGGAGAMSLTMYTVHVLMKTPEIWPADDAGSFPIHVAVVVGIGALFRIMGRKGPLEWLISWVSAMTTDFTRALLDNTVPAPRPRPART